MDFKKNTLTRVTALIYFVGFAIVFYLVLNIADSSVAGGGGVLGQIAYVVVSAFGITIPVLFMGTMLITGFMQIGFSIVRWKKLTIADKVIFAIMLVSFLFVAFVIGYELLISKIEHYQNLKIIENITKQDIIDSCGKVKDQKKDTEDNEALEGCYRYFAIEKQDPSLCKTDDCFMELAKILKSPSLCEKMAWDFSEPYCYEHVFNEIWGSIENKEAVCSAIEDTDNKKCCFKRIELERALNKSWGSEESRKAVCGSKDPGLESCCSFRVESEKLK